MERRKIRANSWRANNYEESQSEPAPPTSQTLALATSSEASKPNLDFEYTHVKRKTVALLVLINMLEFGSVAK